jgi:hypothetical protein
MPTKKKTTSGPKANLMKKNLAQLKAQAKKLKIKGFSTKKKEALVNSIMMAQARKKKSSAPKKSMAAGGKRMMKKRGAKPNRVMRNPARSGRMTIVKPKVKMRRPMMSEYNGWPNYETWLMNLWYGDYFFSYVSEGIEEGWIDLEMSRDPYELGEMLKDHVEELIESEGQVPSSGFVADLFNGAMRDINWYSIGDSLISEL